MIEFKARGNGLLEARGNGYIMFNKLQYVDFELNCIIISEQNNYVYKYSLQNN